MTHPMCFCLVFPIFLTEYISSPEYFVRKFLQILLFFYRVYMLHCYCFLKALPMPIPQHHDHCYKVLNFVCTMDKEKALVIRKHYNFGCAGEREEAPSNWDYSWYYCTNQGAVTGNQHRGPNTKSSRRSKKKVNPLYFFCIVFFPILSTSMPEDSWLHK